MITAPSGVASAANSGSASATGRAEHKHRRCAVGPVFSIACLIALPGCEGPASALMPSGEEAEHVATLFWIMAAGGAAIWSAVLLIGIYAVRLNPDQHSHRFARRLILGGGVLFPVVTLTTLLTYGIAVMPALRAGEPDLHIRVSGEQWWWRITYERADGEAVEAANEIRLPAGRRVEIALSSPDVIHSFWVPALAGKLDLTPGRTTRLVLRPTKTGTYRGICAEFCGASHARMNFMVVVMEAKAFDQWLVDEAEPARQVGGRGAELFHASGCGACHAVRGTEASGKIGPDLTHIGSRLTIAAGTLRNTEDALARWIAHPETVKPSVRMPPFDALPAGDISAIASYLRELK